MAIRHIRAYDEFVDFITSLPTLQEIADFRFSEGTQSDITRLLDANRAGEISPDDAAALDEYLRVEHLVRSAKIRALEKLETSFIR